MANPSTNSQPSVNATCVLTNNLPVIGNTYIFRNNNIDGGPYYMNFSSTCGEDSDSNCKGTFPTTMNADEAVKLVYTDNGYLQISGHECYLKAGKNSLKAVGSNNNPTIWTFNGKGYIVDTSNTYALGLTCGCEGIYVSGSIYNTVNLVQCGWEVITI